MLNRIVRAVIAAAAAAGMAAAGAALSGTAVRAEAANVSPAWTRNAVDLSECDVQLDKKEYTYTGGSVMPDRTIGSGYSITYNGELLLRGRDYDVSYSDNVETGQAVMTLSGVGRYSGTVEVPFMILPKQNRIMSLSTGNGGIRVAFQKDEEALAYQVIYSQDKSFKTYHSTTVTDKERTYVNLTNVPRAGERWYVKVRSFVTADGDVKSARYGEYSEMRSIDTRMELGKVTIPYISYTYSGYRINPTVKVKDVKGALVPADAYKVTYSDDLKVGTARITVKAVGKAYSGSIVKEFYIKPERNSITSSECSGSGFRISWKKGTAGTVGYQVLYSTSEDFSQNVHSYTSADLNDLSERFSRVPRAGETWYVKVRSFFTKDGRLTSTRYGNYSRAVRVVTVSRFETAVRGAYIYDTPHYQPEYRGSVSAGTKAGIIEQSGNWYRITAGSKTGWVYGKAFGKGSGVGRSGLSASNVERYADDILFEIGCSTGAIYRYVCYHVDYSSGMNNSSRNYKAAMAFYYGRGPCYYSAAAADLLLERAGYEHKIMSGIQHSEEHNWNAYYKNGKWLYMETTLSLSRARFYDNDESYLRSHDFHWS